MIKRLWLKIRPWFMSDAECEKRRNELTRQAQFLLAMQQRLPERHADYTFELMQIGRKLWWVSQ